MSDTETEYVYAIGHPHGYAKLGRSNKPTQRLQTHQTSSPYELWIITQLPVENAQEIESQLHERFEGKRVRGEWFELDESDHAYLIELVQMFKSDEEFDSIEDYHEYRRRKEEALLG